MSATIMLGNYGYSKQVLFLDGYGEGNLIILYPHCLKAYKELRLTKSLLGIQWNTDVEHWQCISYGSPHGASCVS